MCSEVQKKRNQMKAGGAKLIGICEESCCGEGLICNSRSMCNSNKKKLQAGTQGGVKTVQACIISLKVLSQHPAIFSTRVSLSLIWLV